MLDLTINDYHISYVVWNIILGIVPFFLLWLLFYLQGKNIKFKKIYQFLIFAVWLVFLPNTPYILTDIRHINGYCPNTVDDVCMNNAWMICFFFLYGLLGWVLYFYALEQMIVFIRKYISDKLALYFPVIISPIVGLGLLLGLIDRLNTWDVIFNIKKVLILAWYYVSSFEGLLNLFVFSLSLLIMYYLGRFIFKPIKDIVIWII